MTKTITRECLFFRNELLSYAARLKLQKWSQFLLSSSSSGKARNRLMSTNKFALREERKLLLILINIKFFFTHLLWGDFSSASSSRELKELFHCDVTLAANCLLLSTGCSSAKKALWTFSSRRFLSTQLSDRILIRLVSRERRTSDDKRATFIQLWFY